MKPRDLCQAAVRVPVLAFLLAGCASGSGPAGAPEPPAQASGAAETARPAASAAVVSYTAEQAERGRQVFTTVCSACHAISEFRGQLFRTSWMSRPVGDFYEFISTAMPQDLPGSLSPEQYAAVVAHVLQLNGVPAGAAEVPADAQALQGVAWPR